MKDEPQPAYATSEFGCRSWTALCRTLDGLAALAQSYLQVLRRRINDKLLVLFAVFA
jgi:hypothetical protein